MNPKKLVRKVVPQRAVRLLENSYRGSRGLFWRAYYGFPARGMRVIAVTGTNGKTTTCSYICEVLKAAGYKTGVYTTAYYEIAGEQSPNRSHMTVASQRDVQDFFKKVKAAGVDFVVLEVTSHALQQGRIDGVPVEAAVLTNLTQDHLDYHGTMEAYASAKARLFGSQINPKVTVLNADDEWYKFFAGKAVGEKVSYGQKASTTLQLNHYDVSAKGSSFEVTYKGRTLSGITRLVGLFNIYNAMAAMATGLSLGIDRELVSRGISNLEAVPGRMENIDEGQDFDVIVDYAITPDALQNVLSSLKETSKGRVMIVFGATGDRDREKRPLMGKVAAENADRIFLTDDETYTEDPKSIRHAVYEGIEKAKGSAKTKVYDDRLEAIKAAFKEAKPDDTVLLAGLGHQDYRNMGGKKVEWDERQIARQHLK